MHGSLYETDSNDPLPGHMTHAHTSIGCFELAFEFGTGRGGYSREKAQKYGNFQWKCLCSYGVENCFGESETVQEYLQKVHL